MLRLHISAAGAVTLVEVEKSSGYEILDAEAVTTVRTWRGAPATLNGEPVATVERLPVIFRLP
jgi:protein TonB